jgi:hypothetical protein
MPPRALPRKAIALFRVRHARGMLTSFSLLETYGLPRPRSSRLFLVKPSPGAFKIVIFAGAQFCIAIRVRGGSVGVSYSALGFSSSQPRSLAHFFHFCNLK